jgi:hypothetical protein
MKSTFSFFLILVLGLSSCNLKKYEGEITTEKRSAEKYDRIQVNGPFEVTIDETKESGLTITAPADALKDIKTEVVKGELIIDIDNAGFINPEMRISIANNQLKAIRISGSGDFKGDVSSSGDLILTVGGSGSIRTSAEADLVEATVSGSGDIYATGSCRKVDANVSGSGEIDLGKMPCEDAKAVISGSGDISLNASGKVDAVISGSGDISIAGNPREVNKSVSGSGDVRTL